MPRFLAALFAATLVAAGLSPLPAAEPKAPAGETRYLTFQVQTGFDVWAGPRPKPGRLSLDKVQLEEFVQSLTKAIGSTGDVRHKLAIAIGPGSFKGVRMIFQGRKEAEKGSESPQISIHLFTILPRRHPTPTPIHPLLPPTTPRPSCPRPSAHHPHQPTRSHRLPQFQKILDFRPKIA